MLRGPDLLLPGPPASERKYMTADVATALRPPL